MNAFIWKATVLLLIFLLNSVTSVASQEPSPQTALLPDVTGTVADRVSIAANAGALRQAADSIAELDVDSVREAAAAHEADRKRVLAESVGAPHGSFSVHRDLLRFPEANRGHAVQLPGRVRRSQTMNEGPLKGFTVLNIAPEEMPERDALVLLAPGANVPRASERVEVVGAFLQLAEQPEQDDAIAPLIVARTVTTDEGPSTLLPDVARWSVVRDRTFGVRASESALYYELLRQASTVDEGSLQAAAKRHIADRQRTVPKLRDRVPFPVFVDLFENPEAYRGKVVSLTGYAREVRKYPAGANAEGIDTLYETWIYTDDSQGNPAVVVSTSIAEEMPIGGDLQVPVRATGYFFKIYGYRAQDTTRVAPMILAGSVERLPEPVLDGPPWWLLGLLGALLLALLAWLTVSYFSERRRRGPSLVLGDSKPDFTQLG